MSFIVLAINFIDRFVKRVGQVGSLLILPLIVVTVFDVITRKIIFIQQFILESPLHNILSPTKLQELEWHLHASIFLLAFGFTYLSNAHVRVDLIRESLSPRKQMLIELLGLCLLALPYLGILIWYAWEFVHASFVQQEVSPSMNGLPYRWIIKSVFLAGITLLCLAVVSTIVRIFIILFSRCDDLDKAMKAAGTSTGDLHVLAHQQEDKVIVEQALAVGIEPEKIHDLIKKPERE
jgi:TRAP-type mannitol/chloroaromatic compound transport system permease small subunit